MNINVLSKNQIRQIVKQEVEKKNFQILRVIEFLNKRVQKLQEELKVRK